MATKTTKKRTTPASIKADLKAQGYRLPHGYDVVKRKTADKKAPAKSNKGTAKLKKITAEAKKIRNHEPSLSWQSAVKLAAKKMK